MDDGNQSHRRSHIKRRLDLSFFFFSFFVSGFSIKCVTHAYTHIAIFQIIICFWYWDEFDSGMGYTTVKYIANSRRVYLLASI